jgi:uncharacterized protein YkwD
LTKAIQKLAVLAAGVPLALAVPAPALAFPSRAFDSPEAELMSLIVTKTNQQRNAAGCGQLDVDQELILASQRQSSYMASTGNFSHIGRGGSTFAGRARAAGYATPAGENIAWGFGSATAVMRAWMASPSHRRNILNCDVQSIGTGVSYSDDGTPYFTQVFGWR